MSNIRQQLTRERLGTRAVTIAAKRLTKAEHQAAGIYRLELAELDAERPRSRADCWAEERPCPFVACKHHLYLDVNPETGSIKINFPGLEPWEMAETCSLDVADGGGETLERTGELMNLTRERTRQIEVRGLMKAKAEAPGADVDAGDIGGDAAEYED